MFKLLSTYPTTLNTTKIAKQMIAMFAKIIDNLQSISISNNFPLRAHNIVMRRSTIATTPNISLISISSHPFYVLLPFP